MFNFGWYASNKKYLNNVIDIIYKYFKQKMNLKVLTFCKEY